MENEIKVNDYVRTKAGQIHKVDKIIPAYENDKLLYEQQFLCWDGKISGYRIWQLEDIIVKHSPNLIDLICEGDYVNGYLVRYITDIDTGINILCNLDLNEMRWIPLEEIDVWYEVATKEMMESISYKVKQEEN